MRLDPTSGSIQAEPSERLLTFQDCRFSVFCSHASLDDVSWNNWISDFSAELQKGLISRVLGQTVPRAFMSTLKPLVGGSLQTELKKAIDTSFALIIFVHDAYVKSDWCLAELAYFHDRYGAAGLQQRLYVVAMSEPALDSLRDRPNWKDLILEDQVVIPFWQESENEQPIPVYATTAGRRRAKIIVNTDFWSCFVDVREDLVKKIKADIEHVNRCNATYPTRRPEVAPSQAQYELESAARVFIEGNESRGSFVGLSGQVVDSWKHIEAVASVHPPLYLRPTGIDLDDSEKRPLLLEANGVILTWAKKPLDSLVAQIHSVEPQLKGPKAPPGLVAYLMEPGDDDDVPPAIVNWPVVRFKTGPSPELVAPLADDVGLLNRFLIRVLNHYRSNPIGSHGRDQVVQGG